MQTALAAPDLAPPLPAPPAWLCDEAWGLEPPPPHELPGVDRDIEDREEHQMCARPTLDLA